MLNKGSRCGFDVASCIVLHGLYRIFLGNIGQHFGMELKNDLHLLGGGTGGPAVVVGGVAVGIGINANAGGVKRGRRLNLVFLFLWRRQLSIFVIVSLALVASGNGLSSVVVRRVFVVIVILLSINGFGMCHLSLDAIFNRSDEILAVAAAYRVQNTFLVGFIFFTIRKYFFNQLIEIGIRP